MGTLHCARNWSRFICKRASEDTTRSAEEKEEKRRRMPNRDFFTSRGAYVKLCYIVILLYTHSIGNQP